MWSSSVLWPCEEECYECTAGLLIVFVPEHHEMLKHNCTLSQDAERETSCASYLNLEFAQPTRTAETLDGVEIAQ